MNVRGRAGRTALHWATQEGSIDAVRVLLERGADVFVKDNKNFMTAEDIAEEKVLQIIESRKSEHHWKQRREDNYEPILNLLIEKADSLSERGEPNSTFSEA